MNKRLFYETPLAELILVRFEGNILSGDPVRGSAGDMEGGIAGKEYIID